MKSLSLLILICLSAQFGFAQSQEDSTEQKKSKGPEPLEFVFRPKLSLGIGMFTFYGDVATNHKNYHPTVSRIAYDLRLINPLTDYLDLNFYVLFGQVSANERTLTRNLNFNSHITTGGLTFTYNFRNFSRFKTGVNPYISAGIESVEFLSKSDLKDANGNTYYYWSDGSIMSTAEDDPNAGQAVQLYRDYTYETDLRELNADGLGKYPERSWAFPVELGANFKINDKLNFRVSTAMHFTTTDLIDNVTGESAGNRSGTKGYDKFLYTSTSMTYDLTFGKSGQENPEDPYDSDSPDYLASDTTDYDNDGIVNFQDLCAKTPLDWRPVDENGCPLDGDNDGVPDAIDMELDSEEGALVDSSGVTYTDDDLFTMYRMYKDSIGEFSPMTEETQISESGGGPKPGSNDGIVQSGNEKITIIIGSDSIGVTPDELHKYLSYNDFKIVDDGENVYYTVGEFDDIQDAANRQKELEEAGITGTKIGTKTKDEFGNEKVGDLEEGTVIPDANTNSENTELIETNVYKVQIGAFSRKLSKNVFRDASDLVYLEGDDGLWRYYTGTFDTKEEAAKHRIDMLESGYDGSFIVAFKGGERITLKEAGFTVNPKSDFEDTKEESSVATEGAINKDLIKFKVQVGAFQNKIPTDILDLYLSIGNVLPRKDPNTGLTKYFIGTFNSYEEAAKKKEELKEMGLTDAFVIGDFNGKIVTAQEALDLLK